MLIQASRMRVRQLQGRYLWIRVVLHGDGRDGPEIVAIRAWANRFSYVDRYLPRVYRESLFGDAATAPGVVVGRIESSHVAALDAAGRGVITKAGGSRMRRSPLLVSILAALGGCDGAVKDTACISVPAEQMTCPASDKVDRSKLFLPNKCGDFEFTEVNGPPKRESLQAQAGTVEACCYPVEVIDHTDGNCVIGRPYFEDGVELSAPLRGGAAFVQHQAEPDQAARASAWRSAAGGLPM